MKTLYAQGAYGRKAARTDWDSGKDFRSCSTGQYFSNRDMPYIKSQGYTRILFLDREARRLFTVSLSNA